MGANRRGLVGSGKARAGDRRPGVVGCPKEARIPKRLLDRPDGAAPWRTYRDFESVRLPAVGTSSRPPRPVPVGLKSVGREGEGPGLPRGLESGHVRIAEHADQRLV